MKKRVLVILIVIVVATLILTQSLVARESQPPAAPQASSRMSAVANVNGLELVSQIGGAVDAVAVLGNYAYYGLGPRLVVLNITDPNHTFVVGRTDVLSDTVNDVKVVGNFAYVSGGAGLSIVNIADPTHPTLVGFAAAPIGTGYHAVAVAGQTAYLAASGGTESGLYLVDVTNPAAPNNLGHYFTSDTGNDVAVVSPYAYLADDSGLRVFNVSVPVSPTLAGSYLMASSARSVTVSGNYAYVGDLPGNFFILNISNLASISQVGSVNPGGGTVADVKLVGNTAYLAAGSQLSIVNVANQASPTVLGYIYARNYHLASAVAVSGAYAYLAEGSGGLGIINVATLATPTEIGFQASMGNAFDVTATGGYVYVTGWEDGFHIVNAANPAAPSEIGSYTNSPQPVMAVAVSGNTAFLGEGGGLRTLNITNRSQPTAAGFLSIPSTVSGVAVSGNYAYLANQDRGLRIINVSNIASPSEVGFFDTTGSAYGVAISGTYAYVADSDYGLRIINIANAASPSEVGSYVPGGSYVQSVAVSGHYAYLAGGGNGLYIVDVANPASPTAIVHSTRQSASDVAVAGNYAYVADSTGLLIVNIADPAHPVDVAYTPLPGSAVSVAVAGNFVYVATQDSGLLTLWFMPPVSASIPVGGGSLLSSQDSTTYTFPSGTFASTAIVTHTLRFPGNVPLPPAGQIGIGHVFEVTATTTSGQPAPIVSGHTYTLTVAYNDAEKGPAIEDTLALYYWNGSQWSSEPSSVVNTSANTVTARPNHFSLWAVFGNTHQVFLPLVKRN